MIERTQEQFASGQRLAVDARYRTVENLAKLLHEPNIEPYIRVFDKIRARRCA